MRAVRSEEIGQVDVVYAVGIFGKTYRAYKALITELAVVYSVMDAAQVDKVKSSASHEEKRLKIVHAVDANYIVNVTAVIFYGKLAYAGYSIAVFGAVSHGVGIEFCSAASAQCFLLGFGLYREYLKHFYCPFRIDSLFVFA